ncbi:hypothetical protein Sjap_005515 [Stephania japonica]|uniref:Uncharacterized protein n=1 Tax=Stephania japonica TaxID=461633 RepID=A0AAP0PIV0_9MAGN
MGEKEVPSSYLMIHEEKPHILYPMYFGVSCAFVALKLLLGSGLNDEKWLETRDRMLQGSAQLLGLLVWRIQRGEAADCRPESEMLQRLEKAEMEVSELKKRRSEDAKANEKVVSIFAAREQTWLRERKKLQKQIGALLHELRFQAAKKEEVILNLNETIKEKEVLLQSRDKSLEEEEGRRKEMQDKQKKAEAEAEELREMMKKEAEEHSSELWKHKTAFIELVSNHRQLESEMGRALRQIDAAKQEINSVLNQKEESVLMVQKLSVEVTKTRKDSEQKDKILSAMLRKSKVDTMEKEVLLKELKVSKARRKEAEIKTEKWKAFHESKHEKKSTTSIFSNQGNARSEVFSEYKAEHPIDIGCSQDRSMGSQPPSNWMNCKNLVVNRFDQSFHPLGNGEFVVSTDVKQLEDWVHSETERITTLLQERHHLEIDAFTEQLQLKDEKLEAFRWRLLSSELEVKRLESHMKGLNQNILQLREEKIKLKALLLEQETKLRSLQEIVILQPNSTHCSEAHWDSSLKDLTIDSVAVCFDAEIVEKKDKAESDYLPHEVETVKEDQNHSSNHSEAPTTIIRQVTEEEIVLEKEVLVDSGEFEDQCLTVEPNVIAESTSRSKCLMKIGTPWRFDLHAMGVSYNIRRLRQQLLLLEKMVSMPEICEERPDGTSNLKTNFRSLLPLLNKQVSRYQSLQEKIDDLSSRTCKDNLDGSSRGHHRRIERTREETRTLECLLEETFQLQRYMVATGQKLIEIQTKMASKYVAGGIEETKRSANFDTARFSDSVRTLFKEVQKGLEVRIARVIGNLEGTLAFGKSFDSVTRAHEAHI